MARHETLTVGTLTVGTLNATLETVAGLVDSNGVDAVTTGAAATPVNNLKVTNAATGSGPILEAVGTDTNVPMTFKGKGTGAVILGQATSTGVKLAADQALLDSSDNELAKFSKAATNAVNEITIANAVTSSGPSIAATGGDTNIPITLKGKGTGAVIVGQATSAGVTLAADQPILDSSSNELVKFSKASTDAVNEITVGNAATGNAPTIAATGETNVPLIVKAKGTGTLTLGQATGKVAIATTAADSVGFFGKTPATQTAVIAAHPTEWTQATTTEVLAVSNKVNELIAVLKTYGFVATA